MGAEMRIMFSLSEACSCGHRSPDRCRHELPRARRNKGQPGLLSTSAKFLTGRAGRPAPQKEPKERIKSHSGFWLLTSGFHIPLLFCGIAQLERPSSSNHQDAKNAKGPQKILLEKQELTD